MSSLVDGIGGFFFRAEDPEALAAWYKDILGIEHIWAQNAGPTVFAPFEKNTDYFGRREQAWMINLRVTDLAALTKELESKGIEVITDPDWNSEVGLFARIHDPEGNPIELWQPTVS